ncbi:MAG: MATE family efflux transporter [Streptosporangiaceae bacterium]
MEKRKHDREILRLAIPAFGALVAEPLFLLADAAIVGRLGVEQQAGLQIAAQVLTALVGICIFLAYGTTAAVARQVGAGNLRDATRQGIDGIWLALAIGLVLIAAGWPLGPQLVGIFGDNPYALTYLRISLLGAPAMLVVLAGTGVLRGLQNGRVPLLVSVGMFTANLILNIVFVLGLGWGIAGSAWGTVVAQAGGAAVYLVTMLRLSRAHGASLLPDLPGVRAAAASGFALVVRTVTLQATLVLATLVAARQGEAQAAAYGIGSRIWLLSVFVLDAVAIAGQSILGRYLGAGDAAGARAVTRRMLWWGLVSGCGFGVLLMVVRPWLPWLFSSSPDVRSMLMSSLVVVALIQPVGGLTFVLDGVLIGAGDMRYLAWAGLVTVLAFLPAVWLVREAGLAALWWAIGLWLTVRLLTLAARVRTGAWLVTGAVR